MKPIIAAVIISLALAVSACGSAEQTSSRPIGSPIGTVRPAPAVDASPVWVKVAALSGGEKSGEAAYFRSGRIVLEGGKQQLRGKVSGDDLYTVGMWQFKAVKGSDDFDAIAVENGAINADLELDGGTYIIECGSANCVWRVTLYELR